MSVNSDHHQICSNAAAETQSSALFIERLLLSAGITRVPEGYERAGHWRTGWNLTREDAAGGTGGYQGHSTVMFTAEGSVYTKP